MEPSSFNEMNLAHAKRFMERWIADPAFQEVVRENPIGACEKYRIEVDLHALRPLWERGTGEPFDNESALGDYPLLIELKNLLRTLANDDVVSRAESAKDRRYKAWRRRQVARCNSQFKSYFNDLILHISACFELTRGCSVGCWFCALDPQPLQGVFEYSQQNKRLWRGVLQTMYDILGPAAGAGMCYCATEPFDNPDYEKFCLDYCDILGVFPPTVTAKATEDFARTRRFMDLNRKKNGRVPSFSITSLEALDSVHSEFSAEELLHTYLVLHNRESSAHFTFSGRAMRNAHKKAFKKISFHEGRTTACVSGFLLNMVEKSVKLVSPCVPDKRWPLGYRTHEKATFTDAEDLKEILFEMMETHMPLHIREEDRVKFRQDLMYRELDEGFEVSTPFMTRRFENHPYMKTLGEIAHSGDTTVGDILSMCDFFSISKKDLLDSLDMMFKDGLLSEELETR
jgi:radical SAM family RiPP maturation amino acid epimerase